MDNKVNKEREGSVRPSKKGSLNFFLSFSYSTVRMKDLARQLDGGWQEWVLFWERQGAWKNRPFISGSFWSTFYKAKKGNKARLVLSEGISPVNSALSFRNGLVT